MKRRLLWINLLLAAGVTLAAWVLIARWKEAEAHQRRLLNARVNAPVVAPLPPPMTPAPTRPADFFDVAQRLLFSKDRNPNVVVEVPPPKVMPPLPAAYGVMNLGDTVMVFLAETGKPQRSYKIGDQLGEFKLIEATQESLTFEWDGKPIKRRLDELKPKVEVAAAPVAAPPPAAAGATTAGTLSSSPTVSNVSPNASGAGKPGMDMGSYKACVPGDGTPAGTVADGFRKVLTSTPFGQYCRWDPVK